MFEVEPFVIEHNDEVHDVAFDFYGRRMATCSSDHTIKVWDEDENGKFHVSNTWKAHTAAVWRLTWAHPEFGQILTSCSFDRTAAIWEEIVGEKGGNNTTAGTVKRWVKRATLGDSRASVCDVEFAPKELGLIIGTASSDGVIRIYEASDIMDLNQWPLQHEIPNKMPLSCLSWNKSSYMLSSQLLAAGSDEAATPTSKVFIYAYNEAARKCIKVDSIAEITVPVTDVEFAPNPGRTFHMLAVASKDLYIVNIRVSADNVGSAKLDIQTQKFSDHNCPVWRVAWNMLGSTLISTGDDGCVRIWRMNYSKQWLCAAILKAEGSYPTHETLLHSPSSVGLTAAATAKFLKKGVISNPNQVPWH